MKNFDIKNLPNISFYSKDLNYTFFLNYNDLLLKKMIYIYF